MSSRFRHGANNERRNGMTKGTKRFPLISDFDAENGIGLTPKKPGKFSTYQTSITGLGNVLDEMEGRTDQRASIPNVCSQIQAVRATVKEYYCDVGKGKHDSVTQWRGAVALLLLYPYLFLKKDMPVWVSTREMPPHISPDESLFLHLWRECIGASHSTRFSALCVRRDNDCYPLLMAHPDCLTIPTAYGVEVGCCNLPWLEKRDEAGDSTLVFADPIAHLGVVALKKLHANLKTLVDERLCTTVLEAVKQYMNAIDAARLAKAQEDAYEVEMVLLVGLLLRNAIRCNLHVVKRTRPSFQSTILTDNSEEVPHDAVRLLELVHPAKEEASYHIILEGQLVAQLDEEHLIWCAAPATVAKSPAYIALKKRLEAELTVVPNTTKLVQLLKYQLERLRSSFGNTENYPYLETLWHRLSETPRAEGNLHIKWKPIGRMLEEAQLEEASFKPLRLICPVQGDPNTLFSDNALCISGAHIDNRLPPEYGTTNSADGTEIIVLPPLGVFGGKVRYTADQKNVQMWTHATENEVTAGLQIRDDHLFYEAKKVYCEKNSLLRTPELSMPLPSVAVWPDVDDSYRKEWKVYYTFVVFNYSADSNAMDADVYDAEGNQVPAARKTSHGQRNEELYRRWQTFDVGNQPAFVAIKCKGRTAGIIPLNHELTKRFGSARSTGVLSVDFGTTSTIGAIRANGNETCEDIYINPSRLRWVLNPVDGDPMADSVFISRALGLPQAPINAVFSLFQTFDKKQDEDELPDRSDELMELHLDGNLYYVAENTELVANRDHVLARIKTRLHEENMESCVAAYLKQILQFYFLKCRMLGFHAISFRYAYPLAFSGDEQRKLKRIFEDTAGAVAAQTGIVLTDIQSCSESMAVAAFFKNKNAMKPLDSQKGIMVLDIGGGTSDFSFWIQNPLADESVTNKSVCYSCRIAGIEMLARFLTEQFKKNELTWFMKDLDDVNKAENDAFVTKWLKQLQQLSPTTDNLLDVVTLYADQFVKQKQDFLKKVFALGKCVPLREAITLNMALLFWLANLIYTGKTREMDETVNKLSLCLAGNGSRIYRALPKETQEKLLQVASETGIAAYDLSDEAECEKTEVAKGLALLSVTEFQSEKANQSRMDIVSATNICDGFVAFMKKYVEVFPGEAPAVKMQETLADEANLNQFRHKFEEAATSIPKLNINLLEISRILNGIVP